MADQTLLLSYLFLVLFQTLHTFEEIACDVFEMSIGHVTVERNRYLLMASVLSTITILPLALLIYDLPLGYYLGLFTSGASAPCRAWSTPSAMRDRAQCTAAWAPVFTRPFLSASQVSLCSCSWFLPYLAKGRYLRLKRGWSDDEIQKSWLVCWR